MGNMGNIKSETTYTYIYYYRKLVNIWRNGNVTNWIMQDVSTLWRSNRNSKLKVFVKLQKI